MNPDIEFCRNCHTKFPFSIDNPRLICPACGAINRRNNDLIVWFDSVICKGCNNLFPYSYADKELICPKCGIRNYPNVNDLVEHHIKYKEIHGADETVWMTKREHNEIPFNSERFGKLTEGISSAEMERITRNAHRRTQKVRERLKRNKIEFYNKIGDNFSVVEKISFYPNTGNIGVSSWFRASRGSELLKLDVKDEKYEKYLNEQKVERIEKKRKKMGEFMKHFPQSYPDYLKRCLEDDEYPRLFPEDEDYIKTMIESRKKQ